MPLKVESCIDVMGFSFFFFSSTFSVLAFLVLRVDFSLPLFDFESPERLLFSPFLCIRERDEEDEDEDEDKTEEEEIEEDLEGVFTPDWRRAGALIVPPESSSISSDMERARRE